MTVRYTAIEGMEEPALRDVDRNAERWRDKIELRLDNRQVFFLFFGSAVVACMLFVLGVMVGKRIESRGQAASPELQDPARRARPRAQAGGRCGACARAAADVPQHADRAEPARPSEGGEARVDGSAGAEARARGGAAQADRACRCRAAAARSPSRSGPRRPRRPQRRSRPSRSRRSPRRRRRPRRRRARAEAGRRPRRRPRPKPAPATADAADAAKGKGKFTLHLSTFATRRRGQRVRAALPGRVRRQRRRPGARHGLSRPLRQLPDLQGRDVGQGQLREAARHDRPRRRPLTRAPRRGGASP